MDNTEQLQDFAAVKARLEEIVEAVSDDDLALDDALDLYEEAINLGLRVSDLLEESISADEMAESEDGALQAGNPFAPSDSQDHTAIG